jgi:hypothetical protein
MSIRNSQLQCLSSGHQIAPHDDHVQLHESREEREDGLSVPTAPTHSVISVDNIETTHHASNVLVPHRHQQEGVALLEPVLDFLKQRVMPMLFLPRLRPL